MAHSLYLRSETTTMFPQQVPIPRLCGGMAHQMQTSGLNPRRVRSKKGCLTCRRRRKKCDEQKPICVACQRNRLECSWPEEANEHVSSPESSSRMPRGFPEESRDVHDDLFMDIFRAACAQPRPRMHPELFFQISENLHHYLDHTSKTLEALTTDAFRPVWTGVVLQDAKAFPFVMNSLDALASLHRASIYPSNSPEHTDRALQSRSAAISEFREMVPEITPENTSGAFIFSALQVILCLGFPVVLKQLNATNTIDDIYELFVSIRGFYHLQPWTCPYITDPCIQAWMHTPRPDPSPTPPSPTLLQDIAHLYSILNQLDLPPSDRQLCHTALQQLHMFFSRVPSVPFDWNFIFTWPVLLSDGFLVLIQSRFPFALVILAYWFAAVFRGSEHWLLSSWAEKVAHDVRAILGLEWHLALSRLSPVESEMSSSATLAPLAIIPTMDWADVADVQLPHHCINPLLGEALQLSSADEMDFESDLTDYQFTGGSSRG